MVHCVLQGAGHNRDRPVQRSAARRVDPPSLPHLARRRPTGRHERRGIRTLWTNHLQYDDPFFSYVVTCTRPKSTSDNQEKTDSD